MSSEFTHIDAKGQAKMVDIGDKATTERVARAESFIRMRPETVQMIGEGKHKKGDVLAVARVAGIMAAKKCPELIPMCHAILLTSVKVELTPMLSNERNGVYISAECKIAAQTGVEMEALTATSVAALTLYDMCKAVDKGMVIEETRLLAKSGGASGDFSVDSLLTKSGDR